MPENLLESELFGHERGAFTGAVAARAGAFEAADGGTLFLDEIGEMPLALQAKLLRVLETSEVQRVGGDRAARRSTSASSPATNRDLEREVARGRFREDLYYRLDGLPAARAAAARAPRGHASPIVTHHLAAIGARDEPRGVRLTPAALEKLFGYGWPGNVRELVNLLERAALLARQLDHR